MTDFDEAPARKPFADLGRDIGDVNSHYAPGEHPAERRAAAQHDEENAFLRSTVRPAMRTNNRLRNYMHFMAPLIQDQENLSDDDSDAVDERYRELRKAGLANTLGGARANATDAGVHDPLIRRDDVGIYRSLRKGPLLPPSEAAAEPDLGMQGRKSLNLWQEGDPEPQPKSDIEPTSDIAPKSDIAHGDYSWHRMSSGTEIRRVGPDEDSDDDADSDDDRYRTNAATANDIAELAEFRKRMGLPPIQQPSPKPPAVARAVSSTESDDDSESDDDADSDTMSLQTESEYPLRGALDINAGLGSPARAPATTGPRQGAMNFSKYFSTFGARMKYAGFWGALGGRGGARAERNAGFLRAMAEDRADAQRRRNAQRWAQPSVGTQLFRKAPYPWMRSAEWNRNARRQVGRGAGDDRLKREWTDDANLESNPALGMSRGSVDIWESNLDQADDINKSRHRGGDPRAAQGDLRRKVRSQVAAQGGKGAAANERTRNLMMMMLKMSPNRRSQAVDAGDDAPYAKGGIIDGIPVAMSRPGDDFEVPRAVTEVFRDFNPKEEVQTGYYEADMRHKFPDIIPGAKGLNARAMMFDSDRTLSNWDPNEAMDLPENDDQV